jgi:hypothetical protein
MALITAANVRERIQGLAASDDTEIGLLIAEADAIAAAWCMWPSPTATVAPTLSVATYVDYLDGPSEDDADLLPLRVRPVVSVTSIYDDPDRVYPAGTLVASSEYSIVDARGVLLDYDAVVSWGSAKRGIKVTYTAGFTDGSAPADLKRALIDIVGALWQRRHVAGLPSATDPPRDEVLSADTRRNLSRYRRLEAAVGG